MRASQISRKVGELTAIARRIDGKSWIMFNCTDLGLCQVIWMREGKPGERTFPYELFDVYQDDPEIDAKIEAAFSAIEQILRAKDTDE